MKRWAVGSAKVATIFAALVLFLVSCESFPIKPGCLGTGCPAGEECVFVIGREPMCRPIPTSSPSPSPTDEPTPIPSPTTSPTPSPTTSPTPTPSPIVTPTPGPSPTTTPTPGPMPCATPMALPTEPVRAETERNKCDPGFELIRGTGVDGVERKYCYAKSECPDGDVSIVRHHPNEPDEKLVCCPSGGREFCAPEVVTNTACRVCSVRMSHRAAEVQGSVWPGYLNNNDRGSYDAYCRRVGDGSAKSGGAQWDGKLIPESGTGSLETWRDDGLCPPRGYETAPCPEPSPSPSPSTSPTPGPTPTPGTGEDLPTGTCPCPPLGRWAGSCGLQSDGDIRCDSTPRFGGTVGPATVCNADHHESCRCSGSKLTGGTWTPCEDIRGPIWTYSGAGGRNHGPEGEWGYQYAVKEANRGEHVLRVCPQEPLLDGLGRPFGIMGGNPCTTIRVEVP